MESILETRAATVTRQSSETGVPRRSRGAHVARAGPRLSDHGQGSDPGDDATEGGVPQLGGSLCGTRCLLCLPPGGVAGKDSAPRSPPPRRATLPAARYAAAITPASAPGTVARKPPACGHGPAAADSLCGADSSGAAGGIDPDAASLPHQAPALGL